MQSPRRRERIFTSGVGFCYLYGICAEAIDNFTAGICSWLQISVCRNNRYAGYMYIVHLQKHEQRYEVIYAAVMVEIHIKLVRHACFHPSPGCPIDVDHPSAQGRRSLYYVP
ncbi:hypothetical protein D3C76_1607060 [compost metagenome]